MAQNQYGKRTILDLGNDQRAVRFASLLPPVAGAATSVSDTTARANWSAVADALTYGLTVATDVNFVNIVPGYNRLVVNDTSLLLTGLSLLTSYWYKVEAWNGRTSGPSNVITFTTLALPVTAGLVLQLKADAIVGLNNGDNVTSWVSSEGNAFTFTKPAYVSGVPTYQTNIVNGKPVVRHVGSASVNKRLTCNNAAFFLTNPTHFAVMAWKTATLGLFRRGPGMRPQSTVGYGFSRSGGTADEYTTALSGIAGVANTVGAHGVGQAEPAREQNGVFFVAEEARVAGLGWGLWINGVQTGGYHTDSNITAGAGLNVYSTSTFFDTGTAITDGLTREDHDLAEVLLYNRNLTNAERNSVRAALGAKYGISVLQL